MKNKIKTILAITLTSTLMLSGTISSYAQTNEPQFDVIAEIKETNGKYTLVRNNKAIPSIPDVIARNKKTASYPDYYNLFEQGKVTNIKNQGSNGICWTFGSLSSLESSVLMKGNADQNFDLSERHLAWFTFNGKDNSEDKSLFGGKDNFSTYGYSPYAIGGSYFNSAATLMRRYGAADQSVCSYEFTGDGALDDSLRTKSNIYLDSMEILPCPAYYETDSSGEICEQGLVPKDEFDFAINCVKEKLMNVGAVDFSIYEGNPYYNRSTKAYYFDASNGFEYANHEICIVGWDDNYSKENFISTPPADGAWIAKNSWGTNWGDNGFFYVSYYDLSQSDFCSFKAEDAEYKADGSTQHVYKNIYQYDGTIFGASQVSTTAPIEAANVFTARSNETLEAISSASLTPNVTFDYRIYTDLQDENDPTSGTLALKGSKTYANAGYYTIPLDSKILLEKNENYSVVISISFEKDGTTQYVLPCEMTHANSVELDVAENVSFYSIRGYDWDKISEGEDFYGLEIGNAIVKAYTNDSYQYGDSNKDGNIDVDDVTAIQCFIAKMSTFDEDTTYLFDLDDDDKITICDVTYLQMQIAGMI